MQFSTFKATCFVRPVAKLASNSVDGLMHLMVLKANQMYLSLNVSQVKLTTFWKMTSLSCQVENLNSIEKESVSEWKKGKTSSSKTPRADLSDADALSDAPLNPLFIICNRSHVCTSIKVLCIYTLTQPLLIY